MGLEEVTPSDAELADLFNVVHQFCFDLDEDFIFQLMRVGLFPMPVVAKDQTLFWRVSDVEEWLTRRWS